MARSWILYGVRSSYVYDAAASIRRAGDRIGAFVDNMPGPGAPGDLEPLLTPEAIDAGLRGMAVLVPLMTPGHRKTIAAELAAAGLSELPPFADPSAVLADDLEMAQGCQINAGVVVAAKCRLERFVLINRSASIGHHAVMEAFVSIGPGAVICGSCRIGPGAFIGAGSVIAPEISIGANATVAAGAVVIRDVPEFGFVAGNPAEVKQIRSTGYNKASV